MSGFAKGMIITGIVLVLLVIAVIAGGIFWISQNSGPWLAKGKESIEEGQRFGRDADNAGCMTATLSRYKQERGFAAAITSQLFLSGCLPASRPTEGFCDNVPRPTDFFRVAEWQREQCEQAGMGGDKYCAQIFSPVQTYCERHRPRAEPSKTNNQ